MICVTLAPRAMRSFFRTGSALVPLACGVSVASRLALIGRGSLAAVATAALALLLAWRPLASEFPSLLVAGAVVALPRRAGFIVAVASTEGNCGGMLVGDHHTLHQDRRRTIQRMH